MMRCRDMPLNFFIWPPAERRSIRRPPKTYYTLEQNMKWNGWPIAEISPLEMFQTPEWKGRSDDRKPYTIALDWIEYSLTPHPTQYRSFRRRTFLFAKERSARGVKCTLDYIQYTFVPILTGLFCIIPCTDNIVKVDLRIVSFDIPPQEVYFISHHFPSLNFVSLYQINIKTKLYCYEIPIFY